MPGDRGEALGCVLALLASPFLLAEKLTAIPRRRRLIRLISAGAMPCPHCHARVALEGRATCPSCRGTSWGSLLSCPIPGCGWKTNVVDCPNPNCKATIVLDVG